jgi:hypothetical protein
MVYEIPLHCVYQQEIDTLLEINLKEKNQQCNEYLVHISEFC